MNDFTVQRLKYLQGIVTSYKRAKYSTDHAIQRRKIIVFLKINSKTTYDKKRLMLKSETRELISWKLTRNYRLRV